MNYFIKVTAVLIVLVSMVSCNLTSAAGLTSQGQPTKEVKGELTSTTANSAVNFDHSAWDNLLKKHVDSEGMVDYKGFKNDREALNKYLQKLSATEPTNKWSVQELLAFYINLYNAYTVDLILNNYPVKSIKDIDGAFTKGFIPVGDRELSLGGIENGILRKMNEPRIHFAINCASISCPKLLDEAYTASKINEQLDEVTREFINSDKNDITANNPKVSAIFKWYAKDYTVNGRKDVIGFINKYSDTEINPRVALQYKDYNWELNEQK
ncbi:DUF547 domain-containing protein [Marixanthomonas spongiae]|uniref:DUF547 domain-containing protein n=1 Tax=Marixanthomonas spongiae TaxID=2174845 RepID=A0A2U0I8F1_9FLAO|nr:DUF547 domain-containing protein [Marixanthomonas spongiae]PVW17377.1 DUF547 domain-containing protein [Marixanthomonas spongiae]